MFCHCIHMHRCKATLLVQMSGLISKVIIISQFIAGDEDFLLPKTVGKLDMEYLLCG